MSEAIDNIDIDRLIRAKSDQLNADDLVSGSITVQVLDVVETGSAEQPLAIKLSGGHRPWKPCKTAIRLLTFGWGKPRQWLNKWITLYRDPDAKWAGKPVGGIRPCAMSDIKGAFTLPLATSKGSKVEYKVTVLTPPASGKPTVDPAYAAFGAELVAATKNGWSNEQVKALLGCAAADVPVERRAEIVAALKAGPQTGGGEP